MITIGYEFEAQLDATLPRSRTHPTGHPAKRLAQGEASVTELAEPFSMSTDGDSKNLRVLERRPAVGARRRRPIAVHASRRQDDPRSQTTARNTGSYGKATYAPPRALLEEMKS